MRTRYCPDCDRNKPAAEFAGRNGRQCKRCKACRIRDLGYRAGRLIRTIGGARIIECRICHGKTVARTRESWTLTGWQRVYFNRGKGVCYEHTR